MGVAMGSIDLAAEPDFRLGPWLVRPSLGMACRDRAEVRLEPRVLQTLIVLVRADGRTVSRAELMRTAWGLEMDDDAIGRCIGKLRAVLAVDGVIGIETIPRTGYRLNVDGGIAEPAPEMPELPPVTQPSRRRPPLLLWIGAAGLALLTAIGALFLTRGDGDTAPQGPVTGDPGQEIQPAISPGGGGQINRSTLLRLSPDGMRDAVVPPGNRLDWDPDISVKGALAFASDRTGMFEIWVADPGQAPTPVTQFRGPFTQSPRWAPDARRLALVSTVDGVPALFILDRASGRLRQVAPDAGAEDRAPSWSRDGQRLYFASNRLEGWRIWITRPPYDQAMPITEPGWRVAKESANGRWLYMVKEGEAGLWRQPSDGGPAEKVADLPDADDSESWVVGPAGVYLVERPGNGLARILLLPADGGPVRVAAELPDMLNRSSLALDPEGRLVVAQYLGAMVDIVDVRIGGR